jgi:hypothetical protein
VDEVELELELELELVPVFSLFEEESLFGVADSAGFEAESPSPPDFGVVPFAEEVDDRESVMYQPLPLKTMPTG